jgi:hypothetical protein
MACVTLSVLDAPTVVTHLDLRRHLDQEWLGTCPSCGYVDGFKVARGRMRPWLLTCFGGCTGDDILDALDSAGLIDLAGIRGTLARSGTGPARERERTAGLGARRPSPAPSSPAPSSTPLKTDALAGVAFLLRTSRRARSGGVVDRYLRGRGLSGIGPYVGDVREHTGARYVEEGRAPRTFPAMILPARTHAPGRPPGLHRTYLHASHAAVGKAPVSDPRRTLGDLRGTGALLSTEPERRGYPCLVGEGAESAWGAADICGAWGSGAVWAALAHGHLPALPLDLGCVSGVLIAADNDDPGLDSAFALRDRLRAAGTPARVIAPSTPQRDWADLADDPQPEDQADLDALRSAWNALSDADGQRPVKQTLRST